MTAEVWIDPGYSCKGEGNACALFDRGRLTGAWFARAVAKAEHKRALSFPPRTIVIGVEEPQQDGRSWDVPPAVLIRLTAEGFLLAGIYAGATGADVARVTPTKWKGSTPKPVMHAILWECLDEQEQEILGGPATASAVYAARERGALRRWAVEKNGPYPTSFKTHNLLDAACMGAIHLGRMR